jgi:transcriptional regulator with XRE-family HTH domain
MEDLSKQLAAYRLDQGLEQKDVATKLGVTQQTVSNWESGKLPKGPRLEQLKKFLSGDSSPHVSALLAQERKAVYSPDSKHSNGYMEWVKESTAEFYDGFGPDGYGNRNLHDHCDKRINFGATKFDVDYMSNETCVILRFLEHDWLNLAAAGVHSGLLELAAVRELHRQADKTRDHYILMLIGRESMLQWGFKDMQTIATIFGIQIYFAPDAIAAAAKITDIDELPF